MRVHPGLQDLHFQQLVHLFDLLFLYTELRGQFLFGAKPVVHEYDDHYTRNKQHSQDGQQHREAKYVPFIHEGKLRRLWSIPTAIDAKSARCFALVNILLGSAHCELSTMNRKL